MSFQFQFFVTEIHVVQINSNYFEFAKQIKTNISIFCHNIINKIAFFLDLKPDFCFLWPMSMDCYN